MVQIVITTAYARSRDTKPHALRRTRTSLCSDHYIRIDARNAIPFYHPIKIVTL